MRAQDMVRPLRWSTILTLTVFAVASAKPALATDTEHPRFAVGLKASFVEGFPHGEQVHNGGGGPFFEWTAVPGWLELELGVKLLGNAHGVVLPADLLFKLPIHVTPSVNLFVGAGPALVSAFADGNSEAFAAFTAVAGGYYALSHHWAITGEVVYELVREHGSTVHEVGVNVGPAFRF